MKKKNLWLSFVCFIMTAMLLLNFSGCGTTVKAADLMNGIAANEVESKEADDAFINNQFDLAVKLFKTSANATKNQNTLISPLSIQLALAMTANGADGETKAQMEKLLGGEITLEQLNEYLHTYIENLPSTEKSKFEVANSIWFRDDANRLTVEKDFLQTNADYYGADAYKAPFDDTTLEDINNWVKDNTDGMIDKILDEIDPNAVMYLINAITFDAEWQEIYNEYSVYDGKFTNIKGEKQDVKMMRSEESRYLSDGKATGYLKNYKGSKYSFAALLPNEGIDLYDYVDSLSAESLKNTLSNPQYYGVVAATPRFSYEYELKMNNALTGLGMVDAFSDDKADFTKLGRSSNGNIYVGEVLHKTFISVDEKGTKAGAVTKVEMKDECAMMDQKTVTLDRPFVYMIIDNSTNLPVFMGAVTEING